MKSLGICIGASTLSVVMVERNGFGGIGTASVLTESHQGNPRVALLNALGLIDIDENVKVTITGRKLRHAINLSSIPESEALETALHHLNGFVNKVDSIVSAGGETFLVYVLGGDGRIYGVKTGNKCASGTGEFFMQQLRRMGISIEEASCFVKDDNLYHVSGRCSVFCKSDCTHAANKGVPKEQIVAGLCEDDGRKNIGDGKASSGQ